MAKQRDDAKLKADERKADEPTLGLEHAGTEPQTTSLRGQPTEKVGGTIGPYKLLDELGEGDILRLVKINRITDYARLFRRVRCRDFAASCYGMARSVELDR